MIHRKPCGCVIEIKYKVSLRGFGLESKKIKICKMHEDKPKMKECFKKDKKK